MEPYIVTIYVLFGIGVLGASHKWTHVGWAWYSVLFPAHAILISVSTSVIRLVKAIMSNETVRKVATITALILFIWYVLWSGSWQQ